MVVISVVPAGIGERREGGGMESQRRGEMGGREGGVLLLFSAFFYFYPVFRFFLIVLNDFIFVYLFSCTFF